MKQQAKMVLILVLPSHPSLFQVRGTQSFSDIIIDLEMQTDRVDLRDIGGISSESDEPLLCHAGILRAARALVARDSTLLDTLQAALEENEDFGVCLTGHSLGGSVAAVAALLLSEYNTEGIQDGNTSKGRWLTSSSSGLPSKRPIRAITFAPPATVSAALAQRASLGIVPLVTTAVLGSDIIPRAGHGQARELRRVLGALSRVRRRHESAFTSSSPSESEDDARVHIIKSWWDWRSICMAVKPDAVMLHRKDRIEEQLWKLRCDVEADLYAAVKSRHDENSDFKPTVGRRSTSSSSSSSSSTSFSNSRSQIPPSPWVGPQQRAKAPLHQLATRRQAIDAATLRSEAAQGVLPVLFPAGRSIWISGSEIYVITSPLAFFSLPDLHVSYNVSPCLRILNLVLIPIFLTSFHIILSSSPQCSQSISHQHTRAPSKTCQSESVLHRLSILSLSLIALIYSVLCIYLSYFSASRTQDPHLTTQSRTAHLYCNIMLIFNLKSVVPKQLIRNSRSDSEKVKCM